MAMRWALSVDTEPASEPVERDGAGGVKEHLRIDSTDEDDLLDTYIKVARQAFEEKYGRACITQTLDLVLDNFPSKDHVNVPQAPLQSVSSVSYIDQDGDSHTFSASKYFVDADSVPGRVVLNDGESWPSETLRPAAAVTVQFVAGYGASGSDVPEPIRQAMKLLVGHMYENREAINIGNIVNRLPMSVRWLMSDYKVRYEP